MAWVSAAEIVAPLELEVFKAEVLGRTPRHLPGKDGRFEHLFGWHDLNRILRHHRLAPPRLRIADLDRNPCSVVRWRTGPSGERTPLLASRELCNALADGATVVVDAVDELHDGVAQVADELRRALGEPAQVNLYFGTQQSQGFGVHRDDHDVFVLQVWGEKTWTMYGRDPVHSEAETSTSHLTSGDVLYLPRGWWHEVRATGGPTLHLTFGVPLTTGREYVLWLLDELADHPALVARARDGADSARAGAVADLRAALADALSEESLKRFLATGLLTEAARPHASLPWSIAPDRHPVTDDLEVRVTFVHRPEVVATGDGESSFVRAVGCEWVLPTVVANLVLALADGRPRTVGALHGLADSLTPEMVDFVVAGLLAQGVLVVAEPR